MDKKSQKIGLRIKRGHTTCTSFRNYQMCLFETPNRSVFNIFQEEYRAKKQNFDEGRAKIPCAPFFIQHALFINNFESIKDAATNLLQEKNFQSVDEK